MRFAKPTFLALCLLSGTAVAEDTGPPARPEGEAPAGVGIRVRLEADSLLVEGVIPGSPAAAAGIRFGERIYSVDGRPVRGQTLEEIVPRIRGRAGTSIDLSVGASTATARTLRLTRESLKLPPESDNLVEHPGAMRRSGITFKGEKAKGGCRKSFRKKCACPDACSGGYCQEEWYLEEEDETACSYQRTACSCSPSP